MGVCGSKPQTKDENMVKQEQVATLSVPQKVSYPNVAKPQEQPAMEMPPNRQNVAVDFGGGSATPPLEKKWSRQSSRGQV